MILTEKYALIAKALAESQPISRRVYYDDWVGESEPVWCIDDKVANDALTNELEAAFQADEIITLDESGSWVDVLVVTGFAEIA